MLARSVDTIVNQVQAMKTLVNEFRDYARLPAAHLIPIELNRAGRRGARPLWRGASKRASCMRRPSRPRCCLRSSATAPSCARSIHNLVQNAPRRRRPISPDGRVRGHGPSSWRATTRANCGRCGWQVDRQRSGLLGQGPQARLRALRDHQEQGHRARFGGGASKIADEHGCAHPHRQSGATRITEGDAAAGLPSAVHKSRYHSSKFAPASCRPRLPTA